MIQYVNALLAAEDPTVTHHWLLPETAEIIYGGLAAVIVVGALVKFAGPAIKKSFNARTEKIQKELDDAAAAKVNADSDAKNIRAALGDIAIEWVDPSTNDDRSGIVAVHLSTPNGVVVLD